MDRILFRMILDDAIILLTPAAVLELGEDSSNQSPHRKLLIVLGDIFEFLQDAHSRTKQTAVQLKMQFYGAIVQSPSRFSDARVRLILGELAIAKVEYLEEAAVGKEVFENYEVINP
jgi:hypothetical protein